MRERQEETVYYVYSSSLGKILETEDLQQARETALRYTDAAVVRSAKM